MRLIALRLLTIGLGFASADVVTAQPPSSPNVIVIRPKSLSGSTPGSTPVAVASTSIVIYPDKPGFITVRPKVLGSNFASIPTTGMNPKLVGAKPELPTGTGIPSPQPIAVTPKQPAPTDKEEGKILLETWDVMFLRGMKAGHYHVVAREYERDGKKFIYATKTQKMTVARFGQPSEIWAEDSTMETPDGAVLVTRMRQGIGRDQQLSLSGQVAGNTLSVKIEGAGGGTKDVPFPDGVIGVAREASILKDRKPKPGESFDYLWYEGRLNRVVKFTATAKDFEELAIYDGQAPRKVLRVILSMEAIGTFRLPAATVFCDATTYEPLRMDTDVPSLGGKVTVLRTTKEYALRPSTKLPELNEVQSIVLDKAISNVHDQNAIVYRVKLTGEIDAAKAFAQDDRQTVKNLDEATKTFELHVKAIRGPIDGPVPAANPGAEFLSDCFFIDWDNDATKQRAKQAIANLPATATAWQKACAVEKWVNQNMRATEFSQAMATCSNVAKNLSGDCTEYAMLGAGMCRAVGIPSRTAIGLVYAPGAGGKPTLAYHMWFEVSINGRWLALDATLGRGSIGAGHIKITDASWHEEKSFAPLLPVMSVLGASPQVKVVSGQ